MDTIDSVAHLEVLLMLLNNRDRSFTPEQVCKELRSNLHSAENQLKQLSQRGLFAMKEDKHYQYSPATAEVDKKISRLKSLYEEMPVAIVTCIYEKPQDRLKDLSDAFKLKKD